MKTLVKTEYDVIRQDEISHDGYRCLEKFVIEASDYAERESQPSFFKRIERGGLPAIKVQNYVGVVLLSDGTQIEVLPKIELGNEEEYDESQTRRIFLTMLQCMDKDLFKTLDIANLDTAKTPLFEVFIAIFLNYVRQLTKRGLKSNYIYTEDNLNTFKGKLLVAQNIQQNLVHQERFYVCFDEFKLNRPENRIIKSTLIFLNRKSKLQKNVTEIQKLLINFELVEPSVNIDSDFSKISIDRNTKDYTTILAWAKIFLQRKSFSTFSGLTSVQSILFPMEKVYESFVAQKMQKVVKQKEEWSDWILKAQSSGKYLFDEPQKFRLKPDLLLSNAENAIVLDTKWKRLINNPQKNFGISQADMYQMFAYGHKFCSSNIWLLYPQNRELSESHTARISFKSQRTESSREINISIFFVDVSQIETSLSNLLVNIKERF